VGRPDEPQIDRHQRTVIDGLAYLGELVIEGIPQGALPEADVAGRQVGVTSQPVKIGERRMRLLARVPVTYIPFVVREGSDFSSGRRTLAGGGVDVTLHHVARVEVTVAAQRQEPIGIAGS